MKYLLKGNLWYQNKRHLQGEEIELDEEFAQSLVSSGVLEPVEAQKQAKASKPSSETNDSTSGENATTNEGPSVPSTEKPLNRMSREELEAYGESLGLTGLKELDSRNQVRKAIQKVLDK